MDTQLTAVLLVVLLAMSAFFSASETAYFSLQRVRLHHLVVQGAPRAKRVARLKEHPERFLATILLSNNLVNTALAALATSLAFSLLADSGRGVGIAAATGAATVGIVVLGEAVPKIIAARYPERLLFLLIRPLEVLESLLFPAATVLHGVSSLFTFPLRRKGERPPLVSEEEMYTLLRLSAAEGVMPEAQAEMMRKAFRMGDLRGQDIMTRRTEIVWVPKEATLAGFLSIYGKAPHTSFPIHEGDMDNVTGVVSAKDVLRAMAEHRLKETDQVAPLARPPYFHPEYKPVADLFRQMRKENAQLAMLVDEFGGVAGLVTLKGIVAEVMGSLADELGGEEPDMRAIDERTIHVDASMRVEEANERLRLSLPPGDYQTLAGFILANAGHIPREGEQVWHDGVRFVVAEMRGPKIERLLVTRM